MNPNPATELRALVAAYSAGQISQQEYRQQRAALLDNLTAKSLDEGTTRARSASATGWLILMTVGAVLLSLAVLFRL